MLGMATFVPMFKNTLLLPGLPEKLQNKIIDKAKLNLSDNISPSDFRKVVQMTMDLINQYEENKRIFKEDKMKQKKMKKLAPKKAASFAKTEESELKSKVKNSNSANIEAAIEKMTNKFTNLALAIRAIVVLVDEKELELEEFQHVSDASTVENLDIVNLSVMNTNLI
ncbi:uncharacterized protein CIMG_12634 [Coccidioides immitis RS]|uniref:Uncharacterized protein n=1 Tax=Coccidioides immitis (strain RS) TaxID=246410 RepID=J3KM20_COCIM|nr:uncharacterized protein CIMG_12634 [Coccidioides immitis RS]EAS37406.3 hypothetical protein CIMG_12634 [Coccidioides immitis RS]